MSQAPMTQMDATWTIQRVLSWSADYLRGRRCLDSPRLDAELLLAHALGVSRLHLYTHFDKPLSAAEREPFKQFLMRRGGGEPVAYITGTKEFMGLAFAVSAAVLIPRPDTEVLVEAALAEAASLGAAPRILDVGTGSGCIAVALARRLPDAAVTAWDVDPEALALARVNAVRLGAERVAFAAVDALASDTWRAAGPFDLIVSNPPYIAAAEAEGLAASVVDFEPHGALFAPEGGMTFYRTFAAHAGQALAPGGRLAVEIGATQGAAVAALFRDAGLARVAVKKDYAKLDRVVVARAPHGERGAS